MRVLVLGASGMLGNAMIRILSECKDWDVYGTIRSESCKRFFRSDIAVNFISDVDVEQQNSLIDVFNKTQPDVVINCIGLVKQLAVCDEPLAAISINALLPHRLAKLCEATGARLVQISTDCIFSGSKGLYSETDLADASDLYGRSKYLGEVDYPHTITLRTSIIGHELNSAHSLISWFLAQSEMVKGFTRAIFSGLPTVEVARVVRDYVIPHPELEGVYHLAAMPINKFDLLKLVANTYDKKIEILSDDKLVIDRSLNGNKFQLATGYVAPEWADLIKLMHLYK
jgi:dTDP-4-dehydrorhamnose reductase